MKPLDVIDTHFVLIRDKLKQEQFVITNETQHFKLIYGAPAGVMSINLISLSEVLWIIP